MRLIDADALVDKLKLYVNGSVIGMIEQAPTIKAIPVFKNEEDEKNGKVFAYMIGADELNRVSEPLMEHEVYFGKEE